MNTRKEAKLARQLKAKIAARMLLAVAPSWRNITAQDWEAYYDRLEASRRPVLKRIPF